MANETVIVTGVTEMRREMRKHAPEVLKELDKELRTISKPIITEAKSLIPTDPPLSGWKEWNTQAAKTGVKVKQGKRSRNGSYSALLQIRNDNAAGSIFSTAGRRNQPANASGANFIKVINDRFGKIQFPATRSLWTAVVNYGLDRYQNNILDAYARAEKEFQNRMDSVKNVGIR